MLFSGFEGDHGFDGNGGQAELVHVVAQHGIAVVFGGRAEGHVNAQAQRYAVVEFVRAVHMGCGHDGIGDGAAGFARYGGIGTDVAGFAFAVINVRHNQIDGAGNLVRFQIREAGRVVKQRGSIGGFGGGGIGGALRGNRLRAEVIAGSGGVLRPCGHAEGQQGFESGTLGCHNVAHPCVLREKQPAKVLALLCRLLLRVGHRINARF